MIFICTCSQDGTVPLLIPHLGGRKLFRFDIDKPENYTWDFCKHGFAITDEKEDVKIDTHTLTSFYHRKPIYVEDIDVPAGGCVEYWCREQIQELFEDFYHECEARGLTTVVHSRSQKYGKLRQLIVAEKYFSVARWHIFHGALPQELTKGKWVVKALVGSSIGMGKAFFVKEIDPIKLDVSYPWFLQEKIDGEDEVTVVCVDGKLFAYRYPRKAIKNSEDVREATIADPTLWKPCDLSASESAAIRGFMAETRYRFGRFDFIRKDGELWFLELNPNGQWGWLDEDGQNGLCEAIAGQIIEDDRRHGHPI